MNAGEKDRRSETAREIACRILGKWIQRGDFPDRETGAVGQHRGFVTEVVFGVCRRLRTLRFFLEMLAPRRPTVPVEAVLLVALYEMFFLDDAEEFAVVHEAVETARRVGGAKSTGFVNAVLRRAQREREKLFGALEAAPPGIRMSHPDELLGRWRKHFGAEKTVALCEYDNTRPVTVIHVFPGCLAALRETLPELVPHPARPDDCFIAPRGMPPEKIPGYDEGWFVVQDPSTLSAVDLLAPQTGEIILDACAAPGGKAAAIFGRMCANGPASGFSGRLVALDKHSDRLVRLRENFARLNMGPATVDKADAADEQSLRAALGRAGTESVDAILLDVPCSNTGVLSRRADARWRFSETRLGELVAVQARILAAASGFVRPGGRMVYSTCSLEPEENARQVEHFLGTHPDFSFAGERVSLPPGSKMDGAYAALLTRR